MDIVYLHERALDDTARLVDTVSTSQMSLPTPCSAWDVRALLTHLIGGNMRWASLPREGSVLQERTSAEGPGSDLLGNDPAGAYRRSAALVVVAWQGPALLDQTFTLPIGVLPGRIALQLHLVETVIHAWDLARATGQYPSFEPDVVSAATALIQSGPPPPRATFAAPVPVADNLPEIDRLAAYLGRTP